MSDWRTTPARQWRQRLADCGLGDELSSGLAVFLALLGRCGRATNLVGEVDEESLLRHHLLESLAAVPFLPGAGGLLDVGSGGGFPGIPLLLARRSLDGVLLEPRERRWAFLREAVRELGLAAEVRRERLRQHRDRGYAVLTVRALAARAWAEDAARVLADGGIVLRWGGVGEEIEGLVRVVTSPLPDAGRGELSVWRRRST